MRFAEMMHCILQDPVLVVVLVKLYWIREIKLFQSQRRTGINRYFKVLYRYEVITQAQIPDILDWSYLQVLSYDWVLSYPPVFMVSG